MRFQIAVSVSSLLLVVLSTSVNSVYGAKGGSNTRQSVPITVPASGPSQTYSQPIPSSYAAPAPPGGARQDMYGYSQPIAAASSQAEYYQPLDYGYAYPRHQQYYEPIPQASGGHHHPIKRGHGYGWQPHSELSVLFIAIPLILIPLLLLWPFFLYAASNHHHPVVYAGGWKRSSDGKIPTVKEAKDKKTDELTEKIVSKLDS